MSFSLTTPQILARTKTVTRRMGWTFLKPGDRLQAIEKGQGLKKGEKVNRLAVIEVIKVTSERLHWIGIDDPCDVEKEGFPGRTREWFVEMFCASHRNCIPQSEVTRIEFRYVE